MYQGSIIFKPSDEMRTKVGKMTIPEMFEEFKTIVNFIGKDGALIWLVYDSLDYIEALEYASSVAPITPILTLFLQTLTHRYLIL